MGFFLRSVFCWDEGIWDFYRDRVYCCYLGCFYFSRVYLLFEACFWGVCYMFWGFKIKFVICLF